MKRHRARKVLPHPTEGAYARLRELIVAGRIAPGTRLIETELARRLLVSRTPIREATRRLIQEGLAKVISTGRRVQIAVAPVTLSDLGDLFTIVGALEGVAGRGVDKLSRTARRSLANKLAKHNSRFEALSKIPPRDFNRFFEAHDTFHSLFVEVCASERLFALIGAVRLQIKRYELIYASVIGDDFAESVREHRAIVSAVRSGTPDSVEHAIRLNWFNSAERWLRAAGARGFRGLGDYRSVQRHR